MVGTDEALLEGYILDKHVEQKSAMMYTLNSEAT